MAEAAVVTNNSMTPTEQGSVSCPLSASQAYHLGVTFGGMVVNVCTILAQKCRDQENRSVLYQFIDRKEAAIATYQEGYKYSLNCELGRFYNTGGTTLETDKVAQEVADTKLIIQRNLNNFMAQMDSWKEKTKDQDNMAIVCEQIRETLVDMYNRLAQLYPSEEIRRTFKEMAAICSHTLTI